MAVRASKTGGLKDDATAKASMQLALEHAQSLKDARVEAERLSYRIWVYCLQQSIEAVENGKDLEIPTSHVAQQLSFDWSLKYLKRFQVWYDNVIADELRRLAKKKGLVPLGLAQVPAYQGKKHAGLRLVPQSQLRPSTAAESPPAVEVPLEAGEASFIARFGFDATPTVRAQVYQLKAANELTDREIRRLKWRGALSTKGNGLVCRANPWLLGVGIAFLLVVGLLLFHATLAFYQVPRLQPAMTVTALGMIIVYAGLGWLVYWYFCAPYFFLRSRLRTGQLP